MTACIWHAGFTEEAPDAAAEVRRSRQEALRLRSAQHFSETRRRMEEQHLPLTHLLAAPGQPFEIDSDASPRSQTAEPEPGRGPATAKRKRAEQEPPDEAPAGKQAKQQKAALSGGCNKEVVLACMTRDSCSRLCWWQMLGHIPAGPTPEDLRRALLAKSAQAAIKPAPASQQVPTAKASSGGTLQASDILSGKEVAALQGEAVVAPPDANTTSAAEKSAAEKSEKGPIAAGSREAAKVDSEQRVPETPAVGSKEPAKADSEQRVPEKPAAARKRDSKEARQSEKDADAEWRAKERSQQRAREWERRRDRSRSRDREYERRRDRSRTRDRRRRRSPSRSRDRGRSRSREHRRAPSREREATRRRSSPGNRQAHCTHRHA